MTTLLGRLQALDPATILFRRSDQDIEAGRVLSTTASAARDIALSRESDLFVVCRSAALQLAGILIGAVLQRRVVLPAHTERLYLDEIGASDGLFVTDEDHGRSGQYLLSLAVTADAPSHLAGHDPDMVFFTSGSTGAPKPVVKRLSTLEREALTLDQVWPLSGLRVEATVSHRHIYGLLYRIVWPVMVGSPSANEPAKIWEQLEDRLSRGAVLISSPAHLKRMPPRLQWQNMRPRRIFSSGAPLPFSAASMAKERLDALPIEVFGSTETGGIAWRSQDRPAPAWTPLPSVQVGQGALGELWAVSPFVADEQPFHMADRVSFEGDGRFHLQGRLDRVVKIEGKRVSLPRIEEALLRFPEVDDVAVIDVFHPQAGLAAVVVLTEAGQLQLKEEGHYRFSQVLRQRLAKQLEPMERPKIWRFVESIETNAQGKRPAAMIRNLIVEQSKCLPLYEVVRVDEQSADLRLSIAENLIWFDGHFPVHAILAGIVQVHIAVLFSIRLWGTEPANSNVSRLKFRKPIHPGDSVKLHLERDVAQGSLRFRYELDDMMASQGIIGHA
ncbi:MAG: AMP-binding protein [Pseudomonadota bacterium]